MKAEYITHMGSDLTVVNADGGEKWLPVKGYEGLYEISNHGKIRSLDRTVTDKNGARKRSFKGRLLTNICSNTGYHHVSLHRNNNRIERRQVHRLVAEHFIPNPDNLPMVDHRNGNRVDNNVKNLRWASWSTNNNNTPYIRYLQSLLDAAGVDYICEEEFA